MQLNTKSILKVERERKVEGEESISKKHRVEVYKEFEYIEGERKIFDPNHFVLTKPSNSPEKRSATQDSVQSMDSSSEEDILEKYVSLTSDKLALRVATTRSPGSQPQDLLTSGVLEAGESRRCPLKTRQAIGTADLLAIGETPVIKNRRGEGTRANARKDKNGDIRPLNKDSTFLARRESNPHTPKSRKKKISCVSPAHQPSTQSKRRSLLSLEDHKVILKKRAATYRTHRPRASGKKKQRTKTEEVEYVIVMEEGRDLEEKEDIQMEDSKIVDDQLEEREKKAAQASSSPETFAIFRKKNPPQRLAPSPKSDKKLKKAIDAHSGSLTISMLLFLLFLSTDQLILLASIQDF